MEPNENLKNLFYFKFYPSRLFHAAKKSDMQENGNEKTKPEKPSEISITLPTIYIAIKVLLTIDIYLLMEEWLTKINTIESSIYYSYRNLF